MDLTRSRSCGFDADAWSRSVSAQCALSVRLSSRAAAVIHLLVYLSFWLLRVMLDISQCAYLCIYLAISPSSAVLDMPGEVDKGRTAQGWALSTLAVLVSLSPR